MRRLLALVVLVLVWIAVRPAVAHEFRPAVLSVQGTEDGRFAFRFEPPLDDKRQPLPDVQPRFAGHCEVSATIVDCGGRGLGRIEIEGLRRHPVDVVVRVRWADGREHHAVLRGQEDGLDLPDRMDGAGVGSVLWAYLELGVEHILIGTDHVMFVLGLTALVGLRRRLLWTVTGFTVAHSITLAMSALWGVSLPSRPVEVGIALSIVLLAVELIDDEPSLSRRAPGAVAFGFGLLHGMGFAGALSEIGLPSDHAALALAGFNIGVELGQLGIVAIAAAVAWAWLRAALPTRQIVTLLAYVGGTVATAWTLERLLT